MRTVLILLLVLAATPVVATDEVFRWVDKNGVIHYGAKPPTKDAKPANLPEIQTYSSRAGGQLPAPQPDVSADSIARPINEVRVLAPVPDEIFRDPSGGVNVTAAVLPALPDGAGVVFYLDGQAKNAKPSPATSTTFNGVERGEHTVSVAVFNTAGKELKRSGTVTFHVKPATVGNDGLKQSPNTPVRPRPRG